MRAEDAGSTGCAGGAGAGGGTACRDAEGAAAFLVYCQGYDGLRDIPAEDAAQFYALLDEPPLLKDEDDTLCAILNEEAAPYFAGHCDEQTAAANMQSRANLYLMEQADS